MRHLSLQLTTSDMTAPRVWDPTTYDEPRRRLVPCFDEFYGCIAELVASNCPRDARVLDLGAGTGILAATIARRRPAAQFTLLDGSADMLAVARQRLAETNAAFVVAPLTDPLPEGPFDAVVSTLAIHHLADPKKADLYARAAAALAPGGVLINGDQIAGTTPALDAAYRQLHLNRARSLGSDDDEIAAAVQRMEVDRTTPVPEQLAWLAAAGLADVDCYWRWYGFAVVGARKLGAA